MNIPYPTPFAVVLISSVCAPLFPRRSSWKHLRHARESSAFSYNYVLQNNEQYNERNITSRSDLRELRLIPISNFDLSKSRLNLRSQVSHQQQPNIAIIIPLFTFPNPSFSIPPIIQLSLSLIPHYLALHCPPLRGNKSPSPLTLLHSLPLSHRRRSPPLFLFILS